VRFRKATGRDVQAIAALHTDSWRRNYRGAYLDSFLDGDVLADRRAVWTDRLTQPSTNHFTVVAERDGEMVGFAHTILDDDPTWGALLENLHVMHDLKRRGTGSELMSESARELLERRPASGLYLWVLEQNAAAQAFYDSRGGTAVERTVRGPFPGGGTAFGLRYAWSDPSTLLADD
jgi:ribosomal protein S18 acetylase RimI-like enzyme